MDALATAIHNVQFSALLKTSPYLCMYGEKPNITHFQPFGVEGWIYCRKNNAKTRSSVGWVNRAFTLVLHPTGKDRFYGATRGASMH